MKNGFVLLAVAVSLAGFAGMMRIKTDVQTLSRERLRLAKEQMQLRETKRVLEAEWAHLANPLRLQKFADSRHYVPLAMQDVLVLAPKTIAAGSVDGGAVWRRALQQATPAPQVPVADAPVPNAPTPAEAKVARQEADAVATGDIRAIPPVERESVMDALELPDTQPMAPGEMD